jgi:hypothetical protein
MMLKSFSSKMPLYLVAAGDADLLSTRSSQSELTPENEKFDQQKLRKSTSTTGFTI